MKKNRLISMTLTILLILSIFLIGCEKSSSSIKGLGSSIDISSDGKIAFIWHDDDTAYLSTSGHNGGHATKLLEVPKDKVYSNPRISPDHSKIVYLSRTLDNKGYKPTDINIFDLESKENRTIVRSDKLLRAVQFFKDSDHLYYIKANNMLEEEPIVGTQVIDEYSYVMDLSTNETIQLEREIMNNLNFFPDKERVLYSVSHFDNNTMTSVQKIFKRSLLNERIEELAIDVDSKTGELYHLVLSDDGRYLAFTTQDGTDNHDAYAYELYLMDMQTHHVSKLTDLDSTIVDIDFSDDSLYFIQNTYRDLEESLNKDTGYHLWRVNLDGSGLEEVKFEF